jgi:hypothetical protein
VNLSSPQTAPTPLPIPRLRSPSSNRWWPLEFDDIAFRIRDVDGRTLSFRAAAGLHWANDNPTRLKLHANTGCVERLYPKAKVIEVSPFNAWRRAAGTPQLAIDWHKVNQGSAGPQLDQAYRILSALDRASK